MNDLTNYDEACRLIANAVRVDEAAEIRSKADALRVYAKQAKNLDLEIHCAQIRSRAERRLGEILLAAKDAGQLAEGRPKNCSDEEQFSRVTLAEAGIDRKLSSRAQRTAEIGDVRFEALMTMMRQQAEAGGRVITDVLKVDRENEQRKARRDLAQALSQTSRALSPNGQRVPCIYADPPWERKQGVTDRSYENHYDTMTWAQICAMPVKERVLDDAWLFLWIPRAHMFALHKVTTEVVDVRTGEVILAEIELPLGWAVPKAWGFDHFCTAFVWTKTDEEHPNDQGGGVLVFDQDEILLMFRRGRGLPKPATDEKFKSNHRERKREHSRKPDHYREMIRAMTGGVPVLELFARVDDEHPLPPDWLAWGNQAAPELDPDTIDDAPVVSAAAVVSTGIASPADVRSDLAEEPAAIEGHQTEVSPVIVDPQTRLGKVEALRAHLDAGEFETWTVLDALSAHREVAAQLVRGVVGDGYADIGDDDVPRINDSGVKFLSALETYAARRECVITGDMPEWSPLRSDKRRPEQIELEQLIASSSGDQMPELAL